MKNLISFLMVLLCFNLFSQDETLMPMTQAGQTGLDLISGGSLQNSVALSSGEVAFPFNLVSQTAPGGIPINVAISYNSNVEYQAKRYNEDVPSGVVGMGWSFGFPMITVDNKMTGTRHDDEFYANGQKLFCTNNNFDYYLTSNGLLKHDVWAFQTKSYSPYTYYYIKDLERWEVKIEGMTYVYGGKTEFPTAVQWLVHWGNWIGDSKNTTGQAKQALAWNLAYVEDQWDQWVKYEYLNVSSSVGSGGQTHTEASYMSKITQSDDAYISFIYGNKSSYEYVEPHQEDYESDAYQERYEKLYLDKIRVYNTNLDLMREVELDYSDLNFDGGSSTNTRKRMLTSIYYKNEYGHASKPTIFQYVASGNTAGKIYQVTTPTGANTYYTYGSTTFSGTFSGPNKLDLTLFTPSGYYRPKVWSTAAYTVVAWYNIQDSKAKIMVYWWDGYWKSKDCGEISNTDMFQYEKDNLSWIYDFEIQLQQDHFAIVRKRDQQSLLKRCWQDEKTGIWTYIDQTIYHNADNYLRLVTGEKFAGYVPRKIGDVTLYYRKNLSWSTQTFNLANGRYFATASNNFVMVHARNPTPLDGLYFYYLNEKGDWLQKITNTGSDTGEFHDAEWRSTNSFLFLNPGRTDHNIRVFDWDVEYNNIIGTHLQVSNQGNIFYRHKELKEFVPSGSGLFAAVSKNTSNDITPHVSAFDGVSWIDKLTTVASSEKNPDEKTFAYQMYFWTKRADQDVYMEHYNPASHSFSRINLTNNLVSNGIIGQIGNGLIIDNDFYWRRPTDTNGGLNGSYLGLSSRIDNPIEAKCSGSDYIVTRYNSKIRIHQYKNGDIVDHDLTDTYYTGGSIYEYGMVGPTSFVTCSASSGIGFSNTIKIHKVIDGRAESHEVDYPVTQIRVNDGYIDKYVSFGYSGGSAFGPGTGIYNKVSVYPGSSTASTSVNGRTDNYFFSDEMSGNGYGNESTYSNMLRGQQYRTATYNSSGTLIADSKLGYNVYFSGEQVKVQQNRKNETLDGVTSDSYLYYNSMNQVLQTKSFNYDANGQSDVINNYFKYVWEVTSYGADDVGIFNSVVQNKKTVNYATVQCSANSWKQWSGKWAPEKSFVWNGGASDFANWTSTTTPSGWLLTNTITSRDSKGGVIGSVGLDGISSASVTNGNRTLTNMTVSNATASEVYFDDFNGGGTMYWGYNTGSESNGVLNMAGSKTCMTYVNSGMATNFRADFRIKLDPGANWASYKFNANSYYGGTNDGNTLRISPNGDFSLYYGIYHIQTVNFSGDMANWHVVSVMRSSSKLTILIDGEQLYSTGYSSTQTGYYHGFFTNSQGAKYDHFRLYPADAFASSTSYEADTYQAFESMDADGLMSQTFYNNWGAPVASIDDQGIPMSTTNGAASTKYNSTFNASDPSRVLSTVVSGDKGFADDFRNDNGGWTETYPDSDVSWSIQDGKLKRFSPTGSWSDANTFGIDLGSELTGLVSIEFDFWSSTTLPSGDAFGFKVGGDAFNYTTAGSELAAWMYLGNDDIKYYNGSHSFLITGTNYVNKSYRIKVTIDTDSDKVYYYLDGKLLAETVTKNAVSGIQKMGFFSYQYGYPAYMNWYVDNFVVYQDGMEAISFAGATNQTIQSMSPSPDNKHLVTNPIFNNLGLAVGSTVPTKLSLSTPMNYQPNATTDIHTANGHSYAYTTSQLELSPLARRLNSGGPGLDYLSHRTTNEYSGNLSSGDFDMGLGLIVGKYHAVKTTSPDGYHIVNFYDQLGNLVISQTENMDVYGEVSSSNQTLSLSSSTPTGIINPTHDQVMSYSYYGNSFKVGYYPGDGSVVNSTTSGGSGNFSAVKGTSYYVTYSGYYGGSVSYVSKTFGSSTKKLTTKYEYDNAGNLIKIYPPAYFNPPSGSATDFITTMAYDQLGRMTSKTTPDNGTTEYIYDDLGRVKFSRDASAAAANNYVFYNLYDFWGRVYESGYCTNSWTGLTPSSTPIGNSTRWRVKTTYDEQGKVTKVENNNDEVSDVETKEEYTYDRYGRVTQVKQFVYDYTSSVQTITYEYDNLGNITKEDYGNNFIVKYYYNKEDGSLKSIGTNSDPDYFASYTYDKNGRLENEVVKNGSINGTFTYDSHGNLSNLKYATDSSYFFNEAMSYTSGGYDEDGSESTYDPYLNYSGLISRNVITFGNKTLWDVDTVSQYTYYYKYDGANRLLVADYNSTSSATYDWGVGGESLYDANGNMARVRKATTTKYHNYYSGTNQVKNTDGSGSDYQYDANGNVKYSGPKSLTALTYDKYYNKVSQITNTNGGTSYTDFQYGVGERVYKYDHNSAGTVWNKTMYTFGLNDFPIKTITKSNSSSDNITYYVYGPTGLIASQQNGAYFWHLKDHQGSTRLVIDNSTGLGRVKSVFNYWPLGEQMLSDVGDNSPYKFTSHERDEETDLNNFRARLYDDEIGKFYAYDPAEQFASPYVGLGNNPVMMVDPDGKFGLFSHYQRVGRIFGDVTNGDWGDLRRELTDYTIEAAIAVAAFYTGGAVAGATSGTLGIAGSNAAGAVASGAISGGGTAGHQSNWNPRSIARGAGVGALSGVAGVVVGDAFASQGFTGLGAFMGGATSSGLSTGLNGGSTRQIIGSSVLGGSLNYGMYHVSSKEMRQNTTRIDRKEIRRIHSKAAKNQFAREYKKIIGADNKQIDSSIEYYEGDKGSVPSKYLDRRGIEMLQKNYWLQADYHSHYNDLGLSGFDGDLGVYLRYQEAYHFTRTFSVGPNQVHTFTGWNGNWNNPVGNQANWNINLHFFNPLFF